MEFTIAYVAFIFQLFSQDDLFDYLIWRDDAWS